MALRRALSSWTMTVEEGTQQVVLHVSEGAAASAALQRTRKEETNASAAIVSRQCHTWKKLVIGWASLSSDDCSGTGMVALRPSLKLFSSKADSKSCALICGVKAYWYWLSDVTLSCVWKRDIESTTSANRFPFPTPL